VLRSFRRTPFSHRPRDRIRTRLGQDYRNPSDTRHAPGLGGRPNHRAAVGSACRAYRNGRVLSLCGLGADMAFLLVSPKLPLFLPREDQMPEEETIERARQDAKEGKAPTPQAGEFVHEEIEHIREGKHGARSTKQAIAIGLSKARRAGVKLPPPKEGQASARARKQAQRDLSRAKSGHRASPARSRA